MKRNLFEARFYQAYYLANVVRNLLGDQFSFLRTLDEFYGDDKPLQFISPFPRYSAFHAFIAFAVDQVLWDDMVQVDLDEQRRLLGRFADIPSALRDLRPTQLPISDALRAYSLKHESFEDWLRGRDSSFANASGDDVYDYYEDLRLTGPLEEFVDTVTNEVFFILFQNRALLLTFNEMMAAQIQRTELESLEDESRRHFSGQGALKRAYMPEWVRRAVYFRDRGFCTLCGRDVSGSTNITNLEHYDHVVPLTNGGLNDVTNVQLLCETCNLSKGGRPGKTSNLYEAWYALDSENDK